MVAYILKHHIINNPASCIMGTGSFPGVRRGQGVMLTPYPLLVPRSKIE